ncbi:MAG: Gfo/Idh/MocA family oxidoreductase, partial [Oscillospiraceae bacterium]|nr:Gfo/Idh/MocA family oxidoreductase [Oscillospiraceae bacterium]
MLKIGIIGAGRIGKVHLESISYHVKNATVVAMADPFMNDETKAFIEGFGVEKIYTDYKEIINDPEIDAVLVCSSTDTHAPISIEAINAGKHVFCEKPLANTVDKIL